MKINPEMIEAGALVLMNWFGVSRVTAESVAEEVLDAMLEKSEPGRVYSTAEFDLTGFDAQPS